MHERKKILGSILTLAFFMTVISAPALPAAFAHGGHQPPPLCLARAACGHDFV
jgi:hypothetical protein